jgi:hypothetical protein
MYARMPGGRGGGRGTLGDGGLGGGLGGLGLGGPAPLDLLVILGVVFATFSFQFFQGTALIPALMRLTPAVWQSGFLWQLATYPFAGYGGSIWILLELWILYMFGKDAYFGLTRRHFWRLIALGALGAAVVAVLTHILSVLLAGPGAIPAPFTLMQGQRMLIVIFIAAFATANRYATILLFFVLPIQARWFLWLEIAVAFIGFLQTKDLPGFLGICAAVGLTNAFIRAGGSAKGGRRFLRELRLRFDQRWIRWKLDRERRKRGLRVIPGEGKGTRGGGRGGGDPWVH